MLTDVANLVDARYQNRLAQVFGENLFGSLTTWLVKPRPHIQTYVDRYVQEFFGQVPKGTPTQNVGFGLSAPSAGFGDEDHETEPYHVIGVHMRSGMPENSQDVRILYVNNRELVFEGLIDNIKDIVKRERGILTREVGRNGAKPPEIRIFMAVDNRELKTQAAQWLRNEFGSNSVVSAEDGMGFV